MPIGWMRRVKLALPQFILLTALACGSSDRQESGVPDPSLLRLSAGASHSCVVTRAAQVQCWGSNVDGQLGDGSTQDRSLPVRVLSVSDAVAVSAGSYHACALLRNGSELCWGWNSFGQIGMQAMIAQSQATVVPGLAPVSAIANGGYHSCALLEDGSGRCWGQNDVGQLGDGGELDHTLPASVFALPAASAIAASGRHTCVLVHDGFHDGTVQCWGANDSGELGDGTTEARPVPTLVNGVDDAQMLAVGFNHSCVLHRDHSVSCWGANDQGQLGDAAQSGSSSSSPVRVPGLEAISLGAGYNHTCAIRSSDHRLLCWGGNSGGQLGDGTLQDRSSPVEVAGVDDARQVAGGSFHTCVLGGGGRVQCWGANDAGQLGDGSTRSRAVAAAPSDQTGD